MVKLIKTEKPTKAEIERGVGILSSLKIVVNVLYALLLFQIFMILPRPDDPELNYLSLVEIYHEHSMKLVVIIVIINTDFRLDDTLVFFILRFRNTGENRTPENRGH